MKDFGSCTATRIVQFVRKIRATSMSVTTPQIMRLANSGFTIEESACAPEPKATVETLIKFCSSLMERHDRVVCTTTRRAPVTLSTG